MSQVSEQRSPASTEARLRLRPCSRRRPAVVVVAASTGSPEVITTILSKMGTIEAPVVIAMHVGDPFVELVVSGIRRKVGIAVEIAGHMQGLMDGHVYFAPGNQHLRIEMVGAQPVAALMKPTPQCKCKPSADILFESAARGLGSRTLGVVLSGMGEDGAAGAQAIVSAGGGVIVQDRESSAVWGMPSAVVKRELACAILSPERIAAFIAARLWSEPAEAFA